VTYNKNSGKAYKSVYNNAKGKKEYSEISKCHLKCRHSIFQISYQGIQILQLSGLLYVRKTYSHIHLTLCAGLPFFHSGSDTELSLEDRL
jgi:hypothetical protein